MKTTEVKELKFEIVPSDANLAPAIKSELEEAFVGFFRIAGQLKARCANITNPKEAREARIEIKNVRISAEKKRKEMKESSLRLGKAIDGANNILLHEIEPLEKAMEDIEKRAEREELARKEEEQRKIEQLGKDRAELLKPYGIDGSLMNLGAVESSMFDTFLESAKAKHEAKIKADLELKEAQEAARLEEVERQKAIEAENARLKAEAEAREKALAEERSAAKVEQERIRAENIAEQKRIEVEQAQERKIAAEQMENDRQRVAKEKEAREKAERELEAAKKAEIDRVASEKAESDRKAKEEEKSRKKAAAAPDKTKLMELVKVIDALELPKMATQEGKDALLQIRAKLEALGIFIEVKAGEL